MAFHLKSPDFSASGPIPRDFSFQGRDINPRLRWSGAPEGTQELALICEDPDAPLPKAFVHWILYGINPNVGVIPAGLGTSEWMELPIVARQGKNSMGLIGYTGPNPPLWDSAHRYFFRLYALRSPVVLPHGAGREEFDRAIEGKVLAEAHLIGLYQKPVADRVRAASVWVVAMGFLGLFVRLAMKNGDSSQAPALIRAA